MNISLTFNVDGTEEEVFGAINSYGVAIQHMSPIIANKNTNKKKVSKNQMSRILKRKIYRRIRRIKNQKLFMMMND